MRPHRATQPVAAFRATLEEVLEAGGKMQLYRITRTWRYFVFEQYSPDGPMISWAFYPKMASAPGNQSMMISCGSLSRIA